MLLVVFVALAGCAVTKRSVDLNKGTYKKSITIRSKPTQAMVYINEKQIGKTPFTTKLEYGGNRLINIKAVPLYPNQYTQNIYLNIPPVPKSMMIYMNHKPRDLGKKAVTQNSIPERHPEVTITRIDTVFIQQTKLQDRFLTPPIIYFENESVKLTDFSKLNDFIKMLEESPDTMIDIFGCSDAKETSTIALSRAKTVFNYFVESGVDPTRLRIFGNGGIVLSTPSENLNKPALNRKVIFELYNAEFEDLK